MTTWILCLAAGLALAALSYGLRPPASARGPFALRALAGAAVVALLLDAPLGRSRPLAPWVALDVSASWTVTADHMRWMRAVALADSLRAAGADSLVLFGDSLRGGPPPDRPVDRATRIAPLADAAAAVGRPVVVITDGGLDDPERIQRLPRGSRIVVPGATPRPDAAIAVLEAPGGALGGDTIEVRTVLRAGAAGAPASAMRLTLDGREIARRTHDALDAFEERELRVRVPIPAADGRRMLLATLDSGDSDARNDTARAEVVVSGAAAAVLVSTAPDQDARFALAVLRGTRRGPVRGYWRVAPGQWRLDGTLRPVDEQAVRAAAAQTPLLVLHGDTAIFGAPRRLGTGGLVLVTPPAPGEEYYATGTGDSPLVTALSGVPWDSLPPLDVAPMGSASRYPAVLVRRARRFEARVAVALDDRERRVALVPASGFWRWRLRGGRPADAFDALWGSIFDWVGTAAAPDADAGRAARSGIVTELVPRPATIVEGEVGEGVPVDLAPRAREAWWLAGLALLLLCAEWVLRRRIGLR